MYTCMYRACMHAPRLASFVSKIWNFLHMADLLVILNLRAAPRCCPGESGFRAGDQYVTFQDHYQQKWNIDLTKQPNPVPMRVEIFHTSVRPMIAPPGSVTETPVTSTKKDTRLFPSLCRVLPLVRKDVEWLQQLPSILWRVATRVLAHELRESLNQPIPRSLQTLNLYEETLASNAARLNFSYERLGKFIVCYMGFGKRCRYINFALLI